MWSNQCSVQCAVCAIFIQTETGFRLAPLAHLCTALRRRKLPQDLLSPVFRQLVISQKLEFNRSLFRLKRAVWPPESACAGAGIDANICGGRIVNNMRPYCKL